MISKMKKEGVQRPFFFMLLNPFHKKMKEKEKVKSKSTPYYIIST